MVTKKSILDENEEHCQRESENLAVKGNPVLSKKTNEESHVTNELAEEISSISHECKCSKTYKTYKSQVQPITKYFRTVGSNKEPINNESSEVKETPSLDDFFQDSSHCSSGVFQVSTKFSIDLSKAQQDNFLLSVYTESPLDKSENSERFKKNASLIVRKRSNGECFKQHSSKKAKADDEANTIKKAQRSSQVFKLSLEFSDDEEKEKEKKNITNGNQKRPTMYLCKHCDYSEVTMAHMRSHYNSDHPYVRYGAAYIQDPCDQSATFCCLECPLEFLTLPDLQRHYMQNHPDRPDFQLSRHDWRSSPEQSACVTSHSTLQIAANKSSEFVTSENISHFPKQTKNGEVSLSLNPENTLKASKPHAELETTPEAVKPAGDGSELEESPASMRAAGYHNAKHFAQQSPLKSKFMANFLQKLKLSNKPETAVSTADPERKKQVCRNGDKQPEVDKASGASGTGLNLYSRRPKRMASSERVDDHATFIHEEIKQSVLEVNSKSFCRNRPLPILFKNKKQVFFCHVCNYRQRTLRQVLHHCLLKHRGVAVSAQEVERYTSMVLQQRSEPLQRIAGQDDNQLHGKEECPKTKTILEKDTAAATKQQRSLRSYTVREQQTNQKITCKQLHAAPKSASPKTKKSKECSLTFHAYQVPLEFDTSPGSIPASVRVSPENLRCSFCAATFPTQDCPDIHCVHKYKGETMQEDVIHARMHLYMCPHCPYVNMKHQGVFCHCRRKHPVLSPGADRFSLDQIYSNNCEGSVEKKGHLRERGYICKICSQICATLSLLNRHIVEAHISTEVSSDLKRSQTPQLTNVNLNNSENLSSPPKSGPKVVLSNEVNKYITSALKSQYSFYTCVLCPKFYPCRKRLKEHYVEKHEKKGPQSKPYSALRKQTASETCDSGPMSSVKKLVFKYQDCPYVHAGHSSSQAHCHIRQPRVLIRRCTFQTDVINVADVIQCQSLGDDSLIRGCACGQCPQIHNSLKTLRIHCELEHNHTTSAASQQPKGSDYQPECPQGPEPEASPSAHNSEKSPSQRVPQTEPEQQQRLECKVCPNVTFDTAEQLILHYSTLHFSDRMLDFMVLSQAWEKNNVLFRCSLCQEQVDGIQKMRHHLDHHRGRIEQAVKSTDVVASVVDPPQKKPVTVSNSADTVLYPASFILLRFILCFSVFLISRTCLLLIPRWIWLSGM